MGGESDFHEPFRFWQSMDAAQSPVFPKDVETTSKIQLLDTKEFKRFVQEARTIVLPKDIEKNDQKMFLVLFERYGIPVDRVDYLEFCEYCAQKGKYTIIPRNEQFLGYNKAKICRRCAGKELLKFVKSHLAVTKNLKNVLRTLLMRFKDVERVSKMFLPTFNPSKNPEMTLYDKISPATTAKKIQDLAVDQLPFPSPFKQVLVQQGIKKLTPVQLLAIEAGAFEGEDLLVVSATSSGKTLIGELCAIPRLDWWRRGDPGKSRSNNNADHPQETNNGKKLKIRGKRKTFLYLVPLVALANQRYQEYRKKFKPLGLRTALRVGVSRVGGRRPTRGSRQDSDIIVGTYEAIDFQLRGGKTAFLGIPVTIVVDEIQMLGDPDRGYLLDGLLGRLRHLFPNAQFIFLSATVANPAQLSRDLNARLVEYKGRPVPLERHLIICANAHEKDRMLGLLVEDEFKRTSSFGFKGQTIVFTYSRRRCHELASSLTTQGIKAQAYHAGLTSVERNRVESLFLNQRIAAVVTTAALGAGIDFPASQVIFASLTMGLEWLTVEEFEQMGGRAGRLGKHGRGKVIILAESDKTYNPGQAESEEKVALRLLGGKMSPLGLIPDPQKAERELLAFLAMVSQTGMEDVYQYRGRLMNPEFRVRPKLREFQESALARVETIEENDLPPEKRISITALGRAMALSFLTVDRCLGILGELREIGALEKPWERELALKELVVELNPLKNVYLTNRVVKELARQQRRGKEKTSNHFFSQAGKAFLDANSVSHKKRLKGWLLQVYLKWVQDLFTCECSNKPDCNCGRRNLEVNLLERKLAGKNLDQIDRQIRDDYEIMLYYGDLLDYFDGLVHGINAVARLAAAAGIPWVKSLLEGYLTKIER